MGRRSTAGAEGAQWNVRGSKVVENPSMLRCNATPNTQCLLFDILQIRLAARIVLDFSCDSTLPQSDLNCSNVVISAT